MTIIGTSKQIVVIRKDASTATARRHQGPEKGVRTPSRTTLFGGVRSIYNDNFISLGEKPILKLSFTNFYKEGRRAFAAGEKKKISRKTEFCRIQSDIESE
jgi:hypothetical protein